jgi:AAA domain
MNPSISSARVNGVSHTGKKPAPIMDLGTFTGGEFKPNPDESSEYNPGKETYHEKFQRSIMDQVKDYPPPQAIINLIQGGDPVPLLTMKSYSLWQGKQKSKKTTLLALAIAAQLRQTKINEGIRFEGAIPGKVLFFDNEQGESYAARTMKLILKLADLETSPNLIYCDLREYSPDERVKIIQAGLECTPDARLLVIDGIVDLLTDFMDPSEGHMSITHIIQLCSIHNIHVAGVLHQNKNDKNARAHVGAISSQKCEIEISTEVDTNDRSQSIVTCVNSRGLPFEPFAIRWDKGSLPCIVQDWSSGAAADEKIMKNYSAVESMAKEVFKPFQAYRRVDAMDEIMKISKQGDSTAKRRLKEMEKWGFIKKGPDGLYRINTEKGSGGHEGSNEGS